MGNQMITPTEEDSPDHIKMNPSGAPPSSKVATDSSCIKEKLDTLIEGYLKSPDMNKGESQSSSDGNNKQGFLIDQSLLKTVQNKVENNNEIVTNGTRESEKSGTPKSDSSHGNSSPPKTEEIQTKAGSSADGAVSNVASFETMIERALKDSMTNVEDTSEKTRILEMCEEEHKAQKNSEKGESVSDKASDDMSLSKKNVMFLKDHIERVLEKNFPNVGSKKEDTNEDSKTSVKTKSKPPVALTPGLTLEQHMQKLIDEHLSKDSASSDSPPLSKLVNSSQSLGDVKKNTVTTSSGGYDSTESSKNKVLNAVSKAPQTNSQSPTPTKSKCHSVETVVDRIIKKAVNDSFPPQKSQTYPKDQKWKSLQEEMYSECEPEQPRKCDSVGYSNSVEEIRTDRMKNQEMKHSYQQKVLNSGKGNNHVEMYHAASQPPYFYPPYLKPNSQYPTPYKQNTKYDNKLEPYSNYLGYPLKNGEKIGRPVSNSESPQRNRMDMSSHPSPHHMHDMHMMPQYPQMDKSKYPHPTPMRYPSKPMEDLSQGSIPSAMAPGPLPAQRYCHPNSHFRMPQLYPNNPPIPSPREYFSNSTNTKDHLLVPGNRNSISKSPVLPNSSPNHLPPSSPRSPRQASPSVYQPVKPEAKQVWQRQDLSPSSQSNSRKREASGLDLSVKQPSPSGNEEQPLDLTCKKPKASPSHPNPAYSSGVAYPPQMDKQHDISKSIHISQLQNSMDKFCQPATPGVDISMNRMPPNMKVHEHYPPSLMANHPQWSNVSRSGSKNNNPPMMPNPGQERLEVVRPHPVHQQHLPRMPIRPPIPSPHHHLPQEAPESPSDATSSGIKRSASVSRHEPIQNIIGNHSPNDILYLICRLCNQTYGSPYGFRKHFRNQHGFEPRSEHTIVQTISGTKALQSPAIGPHFEMQGMNQMVVPSHLSPNPKSRSPREYNISHSSSSNSYERPPSAMSIRHGVGNYGYSPTGNEIRRPESMPNTIPQVAPASESSAPDPQRLLKPEEKSEQHTSPKYLECHECGQTFQLNDFGSYKRHCRTHGNPRLDPFTGGITDNSVPLHPSEEQYKTLSNGKSSCKDGEVMIEVYVCKYCTYTSKVSNILEEHISRQHPDKPKKLICILCNGKFHLYDQFKIHMEKMHNLTAPSYSQFKCPETSIEKEGKIFVKQGKDGRIDPESANIPSDLDKSYKAIPTSQIMKMSADNAVTSASPDSSCDPIASSQADSQTTASVTTSQSSPSEVKSSTQQSQPPVVSRRTSCDSESDKSVDCSEMKYLHKKFKRKAFSSEKNESNDVKKVKLSSSVDSPCSNSCTSLESDSNSVQMAEDSENQRTDKSLNKGKIDSGSGEELNQSEARHHLPYVWDRITRSQVGKTVKPAK